MHTKHINLLFGFIMLALAVALLLETTKPQYEGIAALNNGFPPSFYPRILLSLWAIMATVILLQSFIQSGVTTLPRVGRLLAAVAATATYVWLIGQIGFLLATFPFTVAFLLVQGYRQPIVFASVALVFPTAVWWLMTGPLRIALPTSPWFAAF